MRFGYTYQEYNKDHMARALRRDVAISSKQAFEICSFLRNKSLAKAKTIMERVIKKKQAVPFKRFSDGAGHKAGMAAGAYPIKASGHVLTLLQTVEANAQQKGLSTGDLKIIHLNAHKGSRPFKASRHRGRQSKRTHLEIVVKEVKEAKKETKKPVAKKEQPKAAAKPAPKVEAKPEVKKETPKTAPKQEAPKAEVKQEQPKTETKPAEAKQAEAKEDKQ